MAFQSLFGDLLYRYKLQVIFTEQLRTMTCVGNMIPKGCGLLLKAIPKGNFHQFMNFSYVMLVAFLSRLRHQPKHHLSQAIYSYTIRYQATQPGILRRSTDCKNIKNIRVWSHERKILSWRIQNINNSFTCVLR